MISVQLKIIIVSIIMLIVVIISITIVLKKGLIMNVKLTREAIRVEQTINNFIQMVEKGDLSDIRLTIYYMSPITLVRFPLSVDALINRLFDIKIVVNGYELEMHSNTLLNLEHINQNSY